MAVRADPPFSATPGDTVQLWRVDAADGNEDSDETVADRVDPTVGHRLMTLPADPHPDREFAAILRRGDETMSVVEISAESPLVGSSVGTLDVTIIAVRSAGGDVETIPKRDRLVATGDSLFAIGRPEALQKLESSKGAHATDADGLGREGATGAFLFSQADRENWTEYDDVTE